MPPNDTAYTRWSCHSGLANPVEIESTPLAPSIGGPISAFWASRPCGPVGWLEMLLIKVGDVETNPGPITMPKQVWICDICHRQIQVSMQISIRCNMIEHWVHLRCAGIRLAHYTDTRTCHQHRESRLTTHTDITPPHPHRPCHKPPTHSPHHHRNQNTGDIVISYLSYKSSRFGNAQTQSCHPQHPAPRRTHVTHSTYTSHHTHL